LSPAPPTVPANDAAFFTAEDAADLAADFAADRTAMLTADDATDHTARDAPTAPGGSFDGWAGVGSTATVVVGTGISNLWDFLSGSRRGCTNVWGVTCTGFTIFGVEAACDAAGGGVEAEGAAEPLSTDRKRVDGLVLGRDFSGSPAWR